MNGLNTGEAKGFWQRPEGVVGMLVAGGATVATGIGLYKLLPFLITLLENTLYAGLLVGALLVLSSPLWSTKVRTLVRYGFQSVMRGITGFFITIDPIGILKNYVSDLNDGLANMDQQIGNLNGQRTQLDVVIESNTAKISQEMRRAEIAKQKGQTSALTLASRQAGRLEASNKKLSQLRTKLESLYKTLLKLREISSSTAEDIKNEVDLRETEHKAIKASYGAFKSAMAILNGNGEGKELYDQSLEYLAADYGSKVGEIETFMTLSSGFLASVDLDNAAFELEALDRLEAMAAGDSLFAKAGQKQVQVQEQEVESLYK